MAGGSPRIGGTKKTPSRDASPRGVYTPWNLTCSFTYGSSANQIAGKLAEGLHPVKIVLCAHPRRGQAMERDRAPELRGPVVGVVLRSCGRWRLQALGAPAHLELDLVALGQALESGSLNGAEVHEHVLAVLLGDETEPLRIVEPLHATLSHLYLPLSLRLSPQ